MLATETQYPGSTRQQFSDFESHEVRGPSPGWAGRRELVLGRAAPFTCPPYNNSTALINKQAGTKT